MKYFELDENKRESNIKKHGIDFIDAIRLFTDIDRIELESIRNGESRYETIGIIEGIVIFVVYTYRSEKKRIISARMASKKECEIYYSLG